MTYTGAYDEQLTFSGTVTVTGNQIVLPGVNGTNGSLLNLTGNGTTGSPQYTLQSLSRTLTNTAGQTMESDAYVSITNATYLATSVNSAYSGTAGTNYYATTYGYDQDGRQNMVKTPTGTITRTLYDGLGRAVSSWIGTNDTGATNADPTGGGASGNNMTCMSVSLYDSAGHLTRSIALLSSTTGRAEGGPR